MRRATLAVSFTIAAVSSGASSVRADAITQHLQIDSEVCDPAPLLLRVRALLGTDPFVDDAAPVVYVGVEVATEGVRATIEIRGPAGTASGTRVLEEASCDELAESAALVIVIVLSQVVPKLPVAPVEPVVDEPPMTAAVELERAETDPARPWLFRSGFHVVAGAAGVATRDSLTAAVILGGRARFGAGSLGLELQLVAPDERSAGAGRVIVTTADAELIPCLHRGSLAGCATAAIGWANGRGEDLFAARSATTPLAAVGARLSWEPALTDRLALRVHLGLRVPLTRNRFQVDDMTVWSNVVDGRVGLSLVARIP